MSVRLIHTAAAVVAIAGCHRLPVWHGVVDVTPISRPAINRCGDGAPTALGRQRLAREPSLQSVTGRSANVVATVRPPRSARVVVTSPDGAPITSAPLSSGFAAIAGLDPGRLYCYRLVAGDGALTERAPLTTAAPPGRTVRFVALGDTGAGSDAQRAIYARLGELRFDFAMFLGDIAYPHGTAAQIDQKFFGVYRELLRWSPIYTAIGNHERHTRDGAPYFEAMFLPGRERYYAFDWGDVHFVALDTTRVDREQLEWLDADLAATEQTWIIAFGHHPLFSSSLRGPRTVVRRRLLPILRRHHVDLLIAGHEHHYERFHPIAGIASVVSGGGGGRLTRSFGQAATAHRASAHHVLHLEVSPRALLLRAISIDGVEIDRLELTGRRAAR